MFRRLHRQIAVYRAVAEIIVPVSLRGGIAAVAISCTRLCPRNAAKRCTKLRWFKDYDMVVADSLRREVATALKGLAKTYFVRALHDKLKFAALWAQKCRPLRSGI